MTSHKSTPPEAALVAIDVAKHRNEVLIEQVRGGRRRRMTVLNSRADHDNLIASLLALKKADRCWHRADRQLPPCVGAPVDCRWFQRPPDLQHGARSHPGGPA